MSRPIVRHTPAALYVLVIALCLQLSCAVSESSRQAVLSRTVVSSGFTARRLLQDAELDLASSGDELREQPEGLTEVSSQSDSTDLPSEDLAETATSADQQLIDMDQSGGSESQTAELKMGLSEDVNMHEAESGNNDIDVDRVNLAEVKNENPYLIQSIEHRQDEETPSSAQQSTDQETFRLRHASSGSEGQNDNLQDDDLTFDKALAQAASGKDLSDETGNTDISDSTADLTFAEAVAASKGAESVSDVIENKTRASSSDSDDPTAETPVLESLLPSVESVNGSLNAAISDSDTASSVNASSSSNTSSNDEMSSLVGTAAGAIGQKLSEAADPSESLLDEDTSSIQVDNSAVNATHDFLSEAASSAAGAVTAASSAASSAASGLLSNVTDAVSNTAHTSAATGAASAASDLLSNATGAISSTANSSAVAAAVTATSSLLNNATTALTTPVDASSLNGTGTAAGGAETDSLLPADMLNSTVLESSVADGALHSGLQKVGDVLSGVRSWLNSSTTQEDADDEHITATSASSANQSVRSGTKASQIQRPLTDLEQLQPEEEEDRDPSSAGLMDAASTTGAQGQHSSSSSSASGSRPTHSPAQSRPAAQHPARPSAQGTAATALANATDAATSHRAAAAELGTESGATLSVGKAAGHPASRQQQLPRTADQQVLDSEEGFQNSPVIPRTGATDTSSSRSSSGGAQGAVSAAKPGRDSAAAGSVSGETVLSSGVRAYNSSTDAVVAAAMSNPKSSASASARAAGMNSAVADEDNAQVGVVSQTRPKAAGAQSKSGAASSASDAQHLRQQQEEAQEEEYLERQAKPVSASKAVRPTNVSQQARPVSGSSAGQSASSGRVSAVDNDEYLDGELAELSEEYDQAVDPAPRTAQAQAQARGSSMGKAVDAGRGTGSASERASQGSTGSRPGLQAAMSGQAGSDFDDDYADEIAASQAGRGSSAGTAASTAAQLTNSKAQQSLPASGFDDDALVEDESLGGLQGSDIESGTQSVSNRQSGTSVKLGSQQSRLPSGRQGAVAQDEADSLSSGAISSQAGDWPRTGASGTTPAGKSATGSSGRTGTAGGSSKQVGASHQSGQNRDAQPNAFGNAAASGFGSQHAGAASAEDEETLMQPLGQTAATHSGQSNSARAGSRDQPNALPSSRSASTGLGPLAKVTSGSGSAASSASGTRTPVQQRELEREMAFKASTGSAAHDLMDSKSVGGSLGSLGDRGAASGQSWGALANQNRGAAAGGASSSSRTGAAGSSQSVNTRQQPLGDGESEADIGDYDSRAFGSDSSGTSGSGQGAYPRLVASDTLGTDSRNFAAGSKGGVAAGSRSGTALGDDLADSNSFGLGTGATTKATSRYGDDAADSRSFGVGSGSGSKSTSGFKDDARDGSNSRVSSGFGDEDKGDSSSFMVGRDPTNPSSVVGAQQGFTGQPHAVQQRTSAANAGSNAVGGLPAGKTKMSLDADEDEEAPLLAGSQTASQALSKMNEADVDKSGGGLAGPVVTGSSDDEYVAHSQAGGRQSPDASSTLHSLLDSVINNWVVITALSVFACTGAVLAFVFLRGFVPNPYDVITFSNVGTAGYAGNNGGYTGVSRQDEENGWENGWGDDDAQVVSPQQKSSSNSPPRGTGVGNLKKGTFAKKKPANWSNDF
ncbi:hypothetical protein WJX77_004686 [Trebouxia sp. C0004]